SNNREIRNSRASLQTIKMDSPTFTQNNTSDSTVTQPVEEPMPTATTEMATIQPVSCPHRTICTCEWCGGCRRAIKYWSTERCRDCHYGCPD
ncbi:hypothetical protein CEP54_012099, partial [Fusarium duplospermum]